MDQILGQAKALDLLQAAVKADRLHHAYIFHGPQGVGKFTTAMAFARLLLCHAPRSELTGKVVACGHCESCRLLRDHARRPDPVRKKKETAEDLEMVLEAAGHGHPDLHVVTKELARFSDDPKVREAKQRNIAREVLLQFLMEPVFLSAQLRHRKVFIVDEAELMDPRGQNTLLKTLEEPPSGTVLILVTAHEDRLLPTIRSRCQRVAFLPLPEAVLAEALAKTGGELSADERRWLIGFAGGSLGRMRLALEYHLLTWARTVLPALDQMPRGRFTAALGGQMAALIGDMAQRWVDTHGETTSKEAANKMAAGLMWALITQHARRRLGEAAQAASASGGDVAAAEAALSPWLEVVAAVAEAEASIAANVNQTQVCDYVALRLYRELAPQAGDNARAGTARA